MKSMRQLGSDALLVVAVLSAATMAGLAIKREFWPGESGGQSRTSHKPTKISGWEGYASAGHRMGPASAPVTIVEFADFECPICGRFVTQVLPAVRKEFGDSVAVVFRHWPLKYHKFAYPAARAAECAAAQGAFETFYTKVYAQQDSLGLLSFHDFARESGVVDMSSFDACIARSGALVTVENDIRAVGQLGGEGTPTVLVNNFLFKGAPDSTQLHNTIAALLHRAE